MSGIPYLRWWRSKEEPQVDVQPPKRQRGARTKPKMDVGHSSLNPGI